MLDFFGNVALFETREEADRKDNSPWGLAPP